MDNYIVIIIAIIVGIIVYFFMKYIKTPIDKITKKDKKVNNNLDKNEKKKVNNEIEKGIEKEMKKNIKNLIRKKEKEEEEKEKEIKQKEDLVYLDVDINGKNIGKIIIKLFSDIVPKTCYNFRMLCHKKSYKKSPFHRIIKDFMIQGGDFTQNDGSGGLSIWGDKFDDENFDIQHDQPYLLSMANRGPNTNGSQFFITTSETPHLDGKHVVFGCVIDGFDIVDYLNKIETNNDRPIQNVIIGDCGIDVKK